MDSGLHDICHLRSGRPLSIDLQNRNRYRLIVQEKDGSKTAYCFSTPIYNKETGKLLDHCFRKEGSGVSLIGSNSKIFVDEDIFMQNEAGFCRIRIPQIPKLNIGKEIRCGSDAIFPTTNGVALKLCIDKLGSAAINISPGVPLLEHKENGKYFALLTDRFHPFLTASCIGTLDATGRVIAPASMAYQQQPDQSYRLTISSANDCGKYVLVECNLYEAKLFQDTTVESAHPKENNVFGGITWLGKTEQFGEQWLYTRPDYSRIPDLMDKRICGVQLHLPRYCTNITCLLAFQVASRFCSFGSTWGEKVPSGPLVISSVPNGTYETLDLTKCFTNTEAKTFTYSDGVVIRANKDALGYMSAATADSCYAPQIMEINFR